MNAITGNIVPRGLNRQYSRTCLTWLSVALVTMALLPNAYAAPDFYVTDNGTGSGSSWGAMPSSHVAGSEGCHTSRFRGQAV